MLVVGYPGLVGRWDVGGFLVCHCIDDGRGGLVCCEESCTIIANARI